MFRSSDPHHEFTCITCGKTLDKIVKQFAIGLPKQLIERGQKCSQRDCRVLQPLLFFKIILWVVHCTLIYQKKILGLLSIFFLATVLVSCFLAGVQTDSAIWHFSFETELQNIFPWIYLIRTIHTYKYV
jgi:hypothetical protein